MSDLVPNIMYREIKHPRVELRTGTLDLILPFGEEPERIMSKYECWILDVVTEIHRAKQKAKKFSLENKGDDAFKDFVIQIVQKYSVLWDVKYGNITVRKMVSKWGSCSRRGTLTFNRLLKYVPERLVEYVIAHEVAHLLIKSHNRMFWDMLNEHFHCVDELEKELFAYWFRIQEDTDGIRK